MYLREHQPQNTTETRKNGSLRSPSESVSSILDSDSIPTGRIGHAERITMQRITMQAGERPSEAIRRSLPAHSLWFVWPDRARRGAFRSYRRVDGRRVDERRYLLNPISPTGRLTGLFLLPICNGR